MLDFSNETYPSPEAEQVAYPDVPDVPAASPIQPCVVVSPVFPGTVLRPGSFGSEVARMQTYLNALRDAQFPTLIRLVVDGRYGSAVSSAVMQYQALTGLSMDGLIGRNTWDSIVGNYNTLYGGSADTFPGIALRSGMTGQDVGHMQQRLNENARIYTAINRQTNDSIYGGNMTAAVRRFQRQFGLNADGVLGKLTWDRIVNVYQAITSGTPEKVVTPYSGTPIRLGSSGDDVRFVQSYLNGAGNSTALAVDGIFGQGTQSAVMIFQAYSGLKPDGIVGSITWNALVAAFNAALAAA